METRSSAERQQGLTLLEITVFTALLAVSVFAASCALISQKKTTDGLSPQSANEQRVHQIVSRIEADPTRFPPALSATGNFMTFVGCFSPSGEPVYHAMDLGEATALNATQAIPSSFEAPSGICSQSAGEIEAHISRQVGSAGSYGQMRIHVILLNSQTAHYDALINDSMAVLVASAPLPPNPGGIPFNGIVHDVH